jgi:Ca-activated chloride channel family protein
MSIHTDRLRRYLVLSAVAAAIALTTASPPSASAAGLLVADGGFGGVLEIKEQDVRVTINNSIAVTQIDQVFVNTENRQVEALYTFPVPREASVSNFSMWIAGKEMIGEVVEKERARKIYNSYKQKKRDPGLLEQVDFKQFEMRIFPIAAGAEQRIRIEYYQELPVDHDWATYVYPLATNANGRPIDTAVKGRFSLTVDVKSEVPIEELKSESHADDFAIVNHKSDYAQAALELTAGDLSRDIVMAIHTKRPRTGLDVVTSKPKGEDGYFMMTLTPGDDLSSTAEPMDYLFLLDISGSMARDEKLALSNKSVSAFVESLGQEDRFDCLAFNISPTPLFKELRPATKDNLGLAADFLSNQRARGGTVLRPAITAAYAYRDDDRPLNVVLLSDGLTQAGEQAELMRLLDARPEGIRIFCIGVGNEVNRPLLSQMASQAGGSAAFVSTEDSFARQAQLMRQKLVRPAIQDLSVQFNGSEIHDVEPQVSGDLFYGTPLRMFGRYGSGGSVAVTLSGKVQGAAWSETVAMDLDSKDQGNSEIERMWAQKRIGRLLSIERSGKGTQRDEIVRLSEGYSIVSPYASMLVLENDGEYKRWKIEQKNATRIVRDRAARDNVQQRLAELRRQSADDFKLASADKSTAQPAQAGNPNPTAVRQPPRVQDQSRGVDLNIGGGGGGGGAIEPVTACISLGAVGAAAWAERRRKRKAAGRNDS